MTLATRTAAAALALALPLALAACQGQSGDRERTGNATTPTTSPTTIASPTPSTGGARTPNSPTASASASASGGTTAQTVDCEVLGNDAAEQLRALPYVTAVDTYVTYSGCDDPMWTYSDDYTANVTVSGDITADQILELYTQSFAVYDSTITPYMDPGAWLTITFPGGLESSIWDQPFDFPRAVADTMVQYANTTTATEVLVVSEAGLDDPGTFSATISSDIEVTDPTNADQIQADMAREIDIVADFATAGGDDAGWIWVSPPNDMLTAIPVAAGADPNGGWGTLLVSWFAFQDSLVASGTASEVTMVDLGPTEAGIFVTLNAGQSLSADQQSQLDGFVQSFKDASLGEVTLYVD